MGNELGYGRCDKHTLQSLVDTGIYLLGEIADVPTSKAGSVAHFQAEVLVEQFMARLTGRKAVLQRDGHANYFIETGWGKALLIDFNYETQPVPGTFPLPVLGPMSLLKETKLNHLGKLMFKYVYIWLLLGMPIPLVGAKMSTSGKELQILEQYR